MSSGLCNVGDVVSMGRTPLHAAAERGDARVTSALLDAEADANAGDKVGQTPIFLAAMFGHVNVVRMLLQAGARATNDDLRGYTALHYAAERGGFNPRTRAAIARVLLDAGARLDAKNVDGDNPMHIATRRGYVDLIQLFIEYDADLLTLDKDGASSIAIAVELANAETLRVFTDQLEKSTPAFRTRALVKSCYAGHLGVVKMLVSMGVNVNDAHRSQDGEEEVSGLLAASSKGHLDIVAFLLDQGANTRASVDGASPSSNRNVNGCTPLSIASEEGYIDIVKLLIRSDAAVNESGRHDGTTTLMMAARNGHLSVVEELIKCGAHVDARSNDGRTALMAAAQYGHLSVVNTLITAGASVQSTCFDGTSPLFLACSHGHLDVVNALLHHNVDIQTAYIANGVDALMAAAEGDHVDVVALLVNTLGMDVNARCNFHGYSPLMLACDYGNIRSAQFLIEHDADIEATRMHDNATSLIMASRRGHTEVVRLLLENGANVHATCSGDGDNSLLSSTGRSLYVMRLLIKHGANVNYARAGDGSTALSLACKYDEPDEVKLLIEANADVNIARINGLSPLMIASSHSCIDVVNLLLENGADVTAVQQDTGETALTLACAKRRREIVYKLIACGADVNATRARDDLSALMIACLHNDEEMVQKLIDAEANINACNASGITAYELTESVKIREILLAAGATPATMDPRVACIFASKVSMRSKNLLLHIFRECEKHSEHADFMAQVNENIAKLCQTDAQEGCTAHKLSGLMKVIDDHALVLREGVCINVYSLLQKLYDELRSSETPDA